MEIIWALAIMLFCIGLSWFLVGMLCNFGLVDKCIPLMLTLI